MVLATAAAAAAQDGLRSASLPERPVATAPASPSADVFLAGPKTYQPQRDRSGRDRQPGVIPGVVGGYGDPFGIPDSREITVNVRLLPAEPAAAAAPPAAPAPAAASPPVVAGPPKTFYVIPGCYAGDKHPRDATLVPRCDMAGLRVIPPTVNAAGAR
jgi:hypothetical protein